MCFEPTTGQNVALLDLRSEDLSCHASALSDTAHTSGTAANAPILPALLFLTAAQTFFLSNLPRRLSLPAVVVSLAVVIANREMSQFHTSLNDVISKHRIGVTNSGYSSIIDASNNMCNTDLSNSGFNNSLAYGRWNDLDFETDNFILNRYTDIYEKWLTNYLTGLINITVENSYLTLIVVFAFFLSYIVRVVR